MFSRFKMNHAISASLLILVLASCSTKKNLDGTPVEDGIVTKVSVVADKPSAVSGSKVNLSAVVEGTGTFGKSVTWKILSGDGTLKALSETAVYTASLTIEKNGSVEIEATSASDPSKKSVVVLTVQATTTISVNVNSWDQARKGIIVPSVSIPVKLYDANKTLVQEGITDTKGNIQFLGLIPQEYVVTEDVPVGYGVNGVALEGRRYASRRFPLTTGPQYLETNFTNRLAVVTGQVYIDKDFSRVREPKLQNGNKVFDQSGLIIYDEPGVPGTDLNLTGIDVDGKAVKRTVKTDGDGRFELPGLLAGQYTLTEAQPTTLGDWDDTTPSLSTVTLTHNGTDRSDVSSQFSLAEGERFGDFFFAESDLPVTGLVYLDRDRDGYRLSGDDRIEDPDPVPNVTLRLSGLGQTASTTSDKNGKFIFDRAVPAGKYTVSEDQPIGYGLGHTQVIGTFLDSLGKPIKFAPVAGNSVEVTVPQLPKSGIDPATITPPPPVDPNAPVKPAPETVTKPVEISDTLSNIMGTVFLDDNLDGIRQSSEPGLVFNVPIRLTGTDVNGTSVRKVATLTSYGNYYFADLLQGTYSLEQVDQPTNYLDGKTRPGLIDQKRVGTAGANRIDGIVLPAGVDAGGTVDFDVNLKLFYAADVTDSYTFAELPNR